MNKDKDYNNYLLNEINILDLNESTDLIEKEFNNKLSNTEEINITFNHISNILLNEDNGVSSKLNEVRASLKKIIHISKEYKNIYKRIESVIIELDDITNNVKDESHNIEFNPNMKEILGRKLEKIYSLFRKHNVNNVKDLILIKERLENKVLEAENIDIMIYDKQKNISFNKSKPQ